MGNGGTLMAGHPTVAAQLGFLSGGGPSPIPTPAQQVTDWYIAPISGNDRNTGTSALSPLKSMAEWRRRVWGARYGVTGYPTAVIIHVLESSSVPDDGFLYGFTTLGSAVVYLQGTPIQIGVNGTLTGVAQYIGNNRATVTNSGLPVSWTASYGVSGTGGSRYIRRVGAAAHAIILPSETVPKTVMIGLPTDTSETATGTPTVNAAPFAVNDVYQVVRQNFWPQLVTGFAVRAQLQCLDVKPQGLVSVFASLNRYVLCGFLAPYTAAYGNVLTYNSLFADVIVGQSGLSFTPAACSFLNTCEMIGTTDWATTENVFLANGRLDNHHGGLMESLGTLHMFDNTQTLINLDRGARSATGAVVGSGNSGKLVTVNQGAYLYSASLITATTSDASPWKTAGTSYAAPTVDNSAGTGIYS